MVPDELDLSDYRPSRLPRVLMAVSALAIALVAAWFFSPILLTGYGKAIAMAGIGPRTARVEQPRPPASIAAIPTAPPAALAQNPAPATTATATRTEDNAPAPAAPRAAENNAAAPWPTDTPAWPQPQDQTASAAPAAPPPAQPAAPPPPTPAAANAEPMQLASAAPADTNADAAPNDTAANPDLPVNVPLPRSRPSRQIAARLAIPLPRPRPNIDSDVPTPEMREFELQVERMR